MGHDVLFWDAMHLHDGNQAEPLIEHALVEPGDAQCGVGAGPQAQFVSQGPWRHPGRELESYRRRVPMRLKRPHVATLNEVTITREDHGAVIAYKDRTVRTTHFQYRSAIMCRHGTLRMPKRR